MALKSQFQLGTLLRHRVGREVRTEGALLPAKAKVVVDQHVSIRNADHHHGHMAPSTVPRPD